MAEFYQVKKEIDGKLYTAQFNGIRAAMQALDNAGINVSGAVTTSNVKLADYVFENVIIDPKITVDDFGTMEEMNRVLEFGSEVMQGHFREQVIESKVKTASTK